MKTEPVLLLNEFNDYLDAKGLGKTHHFNIKKYLTFCENNNISIKNITYINITQYMLYIKNKKYSVSYINNLLKAIKCFYRFLEESGQADKSVLDILSKFKLLKVERRIKVFLSREEMEDLVGKGMTFITRTDPEKLKALIFFVFYTGIRLNELINLKRKDIDLKELGATIRVPTKNKTERMVFYPPKVADLLKRYFEIEEEKNNAFNMTANKVNHLIKNLNQYVPQGKEITFHTFRHSFANMLASQEISMKVAQKLLGHKSMFSTMIYYDPDMKIVEKIYRKNVE